MQQGWCGECRPTPAAAPPQPAFADRMQEGWCGKCRHTPAAAPPAGASTSYGQPLISGFFGAPGQRPSAAAGPPKQQQKPGGDDDVIELLDSDGEAPAAQVPERARAGQGRACRAASSARRCRVRPGASVRSCLSAG